MGALGGIEGRQDMTATEIRLLWEVYNERMDAFHDRLMQFWFEPMVDILMAMIQRRYVHPRNYIKISPNYIRSKYD